MIDEICGELRNYFEIGSERGTFQVVDGMISPLDNLQYGQYYRIIGSVFNDGVHRYGEGSLTDEEFTGEIRAMAVPSALVCLAEEIAAYAASDAAKASPYVSESFGGYSYHRAASTNSANVADNSWQRVFGTRLNRWRKL